MINLTNTCANMRNVIEMLKRASTECEEKYTGMSRKMRWMFHDIPEIAQEKYDELAMEQEDIKEAIKTLEDVLEKLEEYA